MSKVEIKKFVHLHVLHARKVVARKIDVCKKEIRGRKKKGRDR
jgi:hypothetical protein